MKQIKLQPLARARAASLGARGEQWLAELPRVLRELEAAWDIELTSPLPGGSTGYVTAVRCEDGSDAVLKIALDDDLTAEAGVLRRAEGHGYARLLAFDDARQALLLERLGASLGASGLRPADQLAKLADTLDLAWTALRPKVGELPLILETDKAAGLAELISDTWERHGRPGSSRAVQLALAYAQELIDPDPTWLDVVHGDPHPHNALRVVHPRPGGETGYCFADPDGFVADRAYDLGVAVRDWTSQLTPETAYAVIRGYCRTLAEHTGVDEERIWRWGFVERVSTGLYVLSFGADRVAQPFLDTAGWLADEAPPYA